MVRREDMGQKLPPGDPDRVLQLEEFLEIGLQGLTDEAVEAGWSDDEVDAALLGLVRARILARIANAETSAAIARARKFSA
jgi:hypothetical protein